MAGYVTKLMGHVYDGANLSGEENHRRQGYAAAR